LRPQGRNRGHYHVPLVDRRDNKEDVHYFQYEEERHRHQQQLEFDINQEEERSFVERFTVEEERGFPVGIAQ